VAALSGAVDVPGLVVWAMALPAPLMASSSPAIASFMKELLYCSYGANLPMWSGFRLDSRFRIEMRREGLRQIPELVSTAGLSRHERATAPEPLPVCDVR
jgi:hypothetical protein